jgi:galactokinase
MKIIVARTMATLWCAAFIPALIGLSSQSAISVALFVAVNALGAASALLKSDV